jgi:iron complex transport system permease protein
VLSGAGLAVSGLLMQTLFRNPLAGPYVLGISAGASLAVAIVLLASGSALAFTAGTGGIGLVAAASVGAGAVLLLVVLAARRVTNLTLLILGVLFGYATSALVTILIHFGAAERVQTYLAWTFGSFGGVTNDELRVLVPVLVLGLGLALVQAKPLNALALGESTAASLGVTVGRTRFAVLAATVLLTGAVTTFCGPVGFLGVAVPHLARGFFRSNDHRLLLPGTALLGGLVALTADLVAQVPGSETVLPLNAVTALVGAPVIAAVVLRRPPGSSEAR